MGEMIFIGLVSTFFLIFLVSAILMVINQITDEKLFAPFKKYKNRNKLYHCKSCKRLYRHYQWRLSAISRVNRRGECVHCGATAYIESSPSYGDLATVDKPDKWMNVHPDCPKINFIKYINILKAIRTIKKLQKEEQMIKRFEEYNKLEVNVDWIMKLQKDLSK